VLCPQYNIKKKEEVQEQMPQEEPNPLMRKKKTPEELAREAEAEEEDEFTSKKGSGRTPAQYLIPPYIGRFTRD
jgi:complexin-1/2